MNSKEKEDAFFDGYKLGKKLKRLQSSSKVLKDIFMKICNNPTSSHNEVLTSKVYAEVACVYSESITLEKSVDNTGKFDNLKSIMEKFESDEKILLDYSILAVQCLYEDKQSVQNKVCFYT